MGGNLWKETAKLKSIAVSSALLLSFLLNPLAFQARTTIMRKQFSPKSMLARLRRLAQLDSHVLSAGMCSATASSLIFLQEEPAEARSLHRPFINSTSSNLVLKIVWAYPNPTTL